MNKKNKKLVPSSTKIDKGYQSLLEEIKSILSKGQYKACKAVDNIKVQTYWQIGERIVREELHHQDRADYGKHLIDNLTVDLNIPRRRLYEIVKFHRAYEIVRSVTAQLSWTHYVCLIEVDDKKKRSFYENKAVLHSWSVRDLKEQIKNSLFEKTSPKEIEEVSKTKLPTIESPEVFQDGYDLNFIELSVDQGEKELEDKISGNIAMFLKALGEDFAFLGRQVPIKIDGETHFIDLVLFHKGIPCNVLVELKTKKLDSRDIGQMNKYIGYYRRNKQYEYEQDTIGLIICQDAGREEITYALDGLEKKIFIATYKAKLPSEEKIRKAIKR